MNWPRATYRLQLHRDFTFAAARACVPYLAQLGISHVYLSPILTARSGSTHGYDVVDYSTVNPELGGEDGLRALVQELRTHAMGAIVDIVPNHMAVGNADNRLWLDVLAWGRASRYANFFDIDWDVPDPALKNKVLAPFLSQHYGDALRAGAIKLIFESGQFSVEHFEHRFPIASNTYPQLLRLGGAALVPMAKRFRDAMAQRMAQRGNLFSDLCIDLANRYANDADVRAALDELLLRFDTSTAQGQHLLHQLLERQHYRLAYWRTAADEINWRRFFDVIQLAGIRIQEPAAFAVVHATIFRLYAEGLIDGVRIDHIDGLADPRMYCRRLRKRLNYLARQRPADAPAGPAYFVVEKILGPEERLPGDWQIDGTTGYSFMNEVSTLLHDPSGEAPLANLWVGLSGRTDDFVTESQRARRRILHELLAAEFNACVLALHRIARSDSRTRDWSQLSIRRVLEELLVQFPIYRTYADARGRSAADTAVMQAAITAAKTHCRIAEQPLLDLLDCWLGGDAPMHATAVRGRQLRLRAIARFQQLSSPLAAKSVEDTAFYRHGKLLSRNEVGADPAQFATTPADFHTACHRRARYFPHALLATATHDHKRGEDLRARLAVLSEIPEIWAAHSQRWFEANAQFKTDGGQPLPGDEYMLYQMLVGGWPLDLKPDDDIGLLHLCERLQQWWTKALREAKQFSSWSDPNTDYEDACQRFLQKLLNRKLAPTFIDEVAAFVGTIARAGICNSLTQTLLKLCAPGIPDIYQGCELWDFSFVDPDNRRPVDYAIRRRLLHAGDLQFLGREGDIKQQLINHLLVARRQYPALFARGSYIPITVTGPLAHHVVACMRVADERALLALALRLPMTLLGNCLTLPSCGQPSEFQSAPFQPAAFQLTQFQSTQFQSTLHQSIRFQSIRFQSTEWRDTTLQIPSADSLEISTQIFAKNWRSLFGKNTQLVPGSQISCTSLFDSLPFVVLINDF